MIESICCFCVCLPTCKTLTSELNLILTYFLYNIGNYFCISWCAWQHPYKWAELNICIYEWWTTYKQVNSYPKLILKIKLNPNFESLLGFPGMHDHIHLKWMSITVASIDAWHHTIIQIHTSTSLWDISVEKPSNLIGLGVFGYNSRTRF